MTTKLAVALVAALCCLLMFALSVPSATSRAASNVAAPTPMVSVTTLPALPSPGSATARPATPAATAAPMATPASSIAPTPTMVPPPGSTITITGNVVTPTVISLEQLRGMHKYSLTLRVVDADGRHRFHTFSGARLVDVINMTQPRDQGGSSTSTRAFILVHGLSGSAAVVTFPEFEPDFAGKRVLLAYLIDGKPGQPGVATLVVEGDATRGRFIEGVTKIEVIEPIL